MPKILVIDDDYELFALLSEYLGESGFCCQHAPDAEAGLRLARGAGVDAVILDVMLPGMSGLDVMRELRADRKTRPLPVLMLTARGGETDRVVGLELGADDYLGKPFSPRELLARLRSLLRRFRVAEAAVRDVGDLAVCREDLSVVSAGVRRVLTAPEMQLLCLLVEEAGEVVNREKLYSLILGHPAYPGDRSLDMLVSRLRKKLGPRPDGGERIKAVRGEGYMFLVGRKAG